MKLAFFNTKSYDREYFERFRTDHELDFLPAPLNEQTVSLCSGHQAVCAFVNDTINQKVIAKLSDAGVRLIALRCAGYNNVDMKAASEYGIRVVRVPAYSPYAVAEYAVALILTLNRKTHKAYNRVREGNFSLENLMGFDLHGKTVGAIGTGKIGAIFCKIMKGFGCDVLAYDLNPDPTLEKKEIRYQPLDELLGISDIISLHCPLMPETHHIINNKTLDLMKKGSMLINTGRGGLIDTEAVVKALKVGKLGYLGMDVYEQEEQFFFKDLSEQIIHDDMLMRLMTFPNVLITSHQGFFTEDALMQIARTTLENLDQFDKGMALVNEVKIQSEFEQY